MAEKMSSGGIDAANWATSALLSQCGCRKEYFAGGASRGSGSSDCKGSKMLSWMDLDVGSDRLTGFSIEISRVRERCGGTAEGWAFWSSHQARS